jgi:hypothetical protein
MATISLDAAAAAMRDAMPTFWLGRRHSFALLMAAGRVTAERFVAELVNQDA